LQDVLDNIARVQRFTAGMTYEDFLGDERTIFAVQYALVKIGETARRLGADAETLCPGQPWRDIRGIGDDLHHAYDKTNLEQIWDAIHSSLPPLRVAVKDALTR
jgi:uncharacterized protein with HEPN domain